MLQVKQKGKLTGLEAERFDKISSDDYIKGINYLLELDRIEIIE